MTDKFPHVGAPDSELKTSPIFDEADEISLDLELEAGGLLLQQRGLSHRPVRPERGRTAVLRRTRCLGAQGRAAARVVFASGGRQVIVTGPHIPAAWQGSAERILRENSRRILVVGETDRGKSTYCRFLVSALLREGRTVSFVDADIGQKDVGPPATVALANLHAPADLAELPCHGIYFVGHVNPITHFLPLVLGTRKMAEAAEGEFVVIDTTGLVQGKGRALKEFQIDSLKPDLLVCLERGEELAPIRHAVRHRNILRLRPSRRAAPKSPSVRRHAREQAFLTHFNGARQMRFGFDRLIVQRSSLFNGKPVADPRYLYAEQLPDGLIAVADDAAAASAESTRVLPSNFATGLLCGMADSAGACLGLGIVENIDFHHRSFNLYTPVPKGRIRIIQFGDLYLDRNGRELHHGRLGHF